MPYLYQHDNIFGFYTSILRHRFNELGRLQDALIDALNRREYLPKYVLVIPDEAIIKAVKFDFPGITQQLERCVKWYNQKILRELESRKEVLTKIRPGAVDATEPCIIWIELFYRPGMSYFVRNNIGKFNKGINEVATADMNTKVLNIKTLSNQDFDFHGNLSAIGQTHF